MRTRIKKYLTVRITLFLLWSLCMVFQTGAVLGEEGIKETQPVSSVIIKSKTHNFVMATKMRFLVTAWTNIYDQKGRSIPLWRLPVPCKAEINYEPVENNISKALKIKILESLPGATTRWTPPLPE